MNHVDLFAGIGGHSVAAQWLGITTVGFCEIDSWNRRVLAKHWPEAGFHDDIKTLTGDTVRRWTGGLGLLTASWPCQPFSVAGQRRGADDDRHLWPEVARIVDETRPRYFLGENVPGVISMELDNVLADLEGLGYAAGAIVVPAGAVNALHRRDRVWIMAHAGNDRPQAELQPVSHRPEHAAIRDRDSSPSLADTPPRGIRRGRAPGCDGQPALSGEGVGDANGSGQPALNGQRRESARVGTANAVDASGGIDGEGQTARTLDPRADGLRAGLVRRPATGPARIRQAWADGSWELDLPRVVADEPERRQKLMAAGNAIVPAVAYEILRVMLAEEMTP